jgi:multicomponent Na+:H+ antiporter subunit B
MSHRIRLILFLGSAFVLAALLAFSLYRLPPFGHYPGPYGDMVNEITVNERRVTNVPTAVMFDIRGLDTLGEEYILFTAITGLTLLLRPKKEMPTEMPEPAPDDRPYRPRSDVVTWFGRGMVSWIVFYGIYVVMHGNLTPGGGFHGGVIVSSAFLLLYLASGYKSFERAANKSTFEALESLGAGAYALIGVATLFVTGVFLHDVLPLGKKGDLTSGGTIPLINFAVGIEVAAGFVLFVSEFLKETRQAVPRRPF